MSAPDTEFKCAECRRELNLGDARSTVLRLMEQRERLAQAVERFMLAGSVDRLSDAQFLARDIIQEVRGSAIALAEGGEK